MCGVSLVLVSLISQEVQGAELAARLEDPATAMTTLLGPELHALGAGGQLLSQQVAELTEHKYSSDRWVGWAVHKPRPGCLDSTVTHACLVLRSRAVHLVMVSQVQRFLCCTSGRAV